MKNTGLSNQSATLSSTRYAERMKNTDNKKGYKTHFNMLFGEWMKNTGLSNNSATPSSTLYAGKMKNTDKRTTSFRNQFVIPDIKKERTTILKMKLTMPMKLEFPFG
ncbi:hypothetical protein CVS40_11887 [Lucilia cuprina]|nr:hypothetical protein CVS40_11887 [Lucilia cuprina]